MHSTGRQVDIQLIGEFQERKGFAIFINQFSGTVPFCSRPKARMVYWYFAVDGAIHHMRYIALKTVTNII